MGAMPNPFPLFSKRGTREFTMSLFKGRKAEKQAEDFLKDQGLSLIKKNFFCKAGEVDLIMNDNGEIVFVEVRARKTKTHGSAAESIDSKKQQKICKSARFFLHENPQYHNNNCRFDVIVFNQFEQKGVKVEWLKDAFWLSETFSIL